MKLKTRRQDFVVREISQLAIVDEGPFATYQLVKSGIGTMEAVRSIVQTWNLPAKDVSYGGKKDRHAETSQKLTIRGGPQEDLEQREFFLHYLGQAQTPFTSKQIVGNSFAIQLRDLDLDSAEALVKLVETPPLIPNYFDQQRFGSVGVNGAFVAVPWCLKDYERALFLALAEHNKIDAPEEREQKRILQQHWGDWETCKEQLSRSNRRSVVTYLVDHPQGFKKAAALIHRDQRSLYISALQSKIWNEVIASWLRELVGEEERSILEERCGVLVFPREASSKLQELQAVELALPSGRPTKWHPRMRRLLDAVVAEMGLAVHQLRFSHPRDAFFSRMRRQVFMHPKHLSASAQPDELSEGRFKVIMEFELPPGQYATMLVKGLQLAATPPS